MPVRREAHLEPSAPARRGRRLHRPAVGGDDLGDDRQAQPRAALFTGAGVVESNETLERPGSLVDGNSRPVVVDRDRAIPSQLDQLGKPPCSLRAGGVGCEVGNDHPGKLVRAALHPARHDRRYRPDCRVARSRAGLLEDQVVQIDLDPLARACLSSASGSVNRSSTSACIAGLSAGRFRQPGGRWASGCFIGTSACWRRLASGERSSCEASRRKRLCRVWDPAGGRASGSSCWPGGDLVLAARLGDPAIQLVDEIRSTCLRIPSTGARALPTTLHITRANVASRSGRPNGQKPAQDESRVRDLFERQSDDHLERPPAGRAWCATPMNWSSSKSTLQLRGLPGSTQGVRGPAARSSRATAAPAGSRIWISSSSSVELGNSRPSVDSIARAISSARRRAPRSPRWSGPRGSAQAGQTRPRAGPSRRSGGPQRRANPDRPEPRRPDSQPPLAASW